MIETIMIEGKAVEIDSASGWTYCYREQFGHDILPDMLPIARSIAVAAEGLLRELPDAYSRMSGRNPDEIAEEHPMQALAILVGRFLTEYPETAEMLTMAGTDAPKAA